MLTEYYEKNKAFQKGLRKIPKFDEYKKIGYYKKFF